MESLIVKHIVRIIKKYTWAGVLAILLVVETIAAAVYIEGEVQENQNVSEAVKVTAVSAKEMTDVSGEKGYCFTVSVVNEGSNMEMARIVCQDEAGKNVTKIPISEYQNIKITNEWYDIMKGDNAIPPGTQAQLQFFIKSETLDKVTGESICFLDNTSKIGTNIKISTIKSQ